MPPARPRRPVHPARGEGGRPGDVPLPGLRGRDRHLERRPDLLAAVPGRRVGVRAAHDRGTGPGRPDRVGRGAAALVRGRAEGGDELAAVGGGVGQGGRPREPAGPRPREPCRRGGDEGEGVDRRGARCVSERSKRLGLRPERGGGRRWTPEQDVQLGTAPDAVLAGRFGRTTKAVRVRRSKLGVPTSDDRRRTR
jgi:hypothetical protein